MDRPETPCPGRNQALADYRRSSARHPICTWWSDTRRYCASMACCSRLSEPDLGKEQLEKLLPAACPPPFDERFRNEKNTDFSLEITIANIRQRFRANYFFNGQNMGACFRVIPSTIPDFQWAHFPAELADRLTGFRNGLILVSGVTGSGKTTTLAMLINKFNLAGGNRIITIEEPIEYIFPRVPTSIVTQREVGVDVSTFADGLKYGLRQDPDVILVGEIRDRDTAQIALSAAETGHLVLSTLHTRDAKGAISRFVDLFPQTVQHEVRAQLAMGLRAVVSQHLLPEHCARHQTRTGAGNNVQQFADLQRHSFREDRIDRQLHPDRSSGGDAHARRIDSPPDAGRPHRSANRRALRQRSHRVGPPPLTEVAC